MMMMIRRLFVTCCHGGTQSYSRFVRGFQSLWVNWQLGFCRLLLMMPKISPINCTVLARSYWHLHNEKKKESLRSAPVWYGPNTLRRSSQNYSHYSRVLERVKSCVPFFVRVLGFYSSRAGPFFLGVEVFSL